MSAQNMSAALRTRGLELSARAVFCYLCDRANGARVCWPSVEAIAWELELSRRSVLAAIKTLRERKLIAVETRYKQASVYRILTIPEPPRYSATIAPEAVCGETIAPENSGATTAPEPSAVQNPTFSGAKNSTSGVQPLHPESPIESPIRESPKERKNVVLRTTPPTEPAAPVEDVRKQLYSEGKEIVRRCTGRLNGTAGGLITDFLKRANQDCGIVLSVLNAAEREGVPPDGFVAWVVAGIKHRLAPKPEFDPANLTGAGKVLWRIKQDRERLQREAGGDYVQ